MNFILSFIFNIILSTIAILAVTYILPDTSVNSIITAVFVAVVLGVANATIRPILHLLTLPISVVTLGLFALVINGFVVWLVALIIPGFEIGGILNAILFSIVLSIINLILNAIFK